MTFQDLMDCNPSENEYVWNELLKQWERMPVIPVIGAGLSKWCYPMWGELLINIANTCNCTKEVKLYLKNGQSEKAAQLIQSKIGKWNFQKKVVNEMSEEKLEDLSNRPKYQELLKQIFTGIVITTNFDRALERCFDHIQVHYPCDPWGEKAAYAALQANEKILFKLHGDINDMEHIVLTEESYDATYGKAGKLDFDKPEPKLLKKVFENRSILFLGCSLNSDRTLDVLQEANVGTYFAVLPLPKETENKNNPLKPNCNVDAYFERLKTLGDKYHIQAIWYPYGKADEALEALINELYAFIKKKEINYPKQKNVFNDRLYNHIIPFVGRKKEINSIVNLLKNSDNNLVMVVGYPGMGKTALCKEVYWTMKSQVESFIFPFIDLRDCFNIEAFIGRIVQALSLSINGVNSLEKLYEIIKKFYYKCYGFYFDNWEDIWNYTGRDEHIKIVNFIRNLQDSDFHILISSCVETLALTTQPYIIPQLSKSDAKTLFLQQWGYKSIPKGKGEILRNLLDKLSGHALSIVLTATQAHGNPQIENWSEQWSMVECEVLAELNDSDHKSLEISLAMSWKYVSRVKTAIILWGIIAYYPKDFPYCLFKYLPQTKDGEVSWKGALKILQDNSLVDYSDDGNFVRMLPAIKSQWEILNDNLDNERESYALLLIAIFRLVKYKDEAFLLSNGAIQDILSVLAEAWNRRYYKGVDLISVWLCDYFKYSINQSKELLDKMLNSKRYVLSDIHIAIFKITYGEIYSVIGEYNKAQNQYKAAEEIMQNFPNRKYLANIYIEQGNVYLEQVQLDKAENKLNCALKIFNDIKDKSGIISVYFSLGDVCVAKGMYNKAHKYYDQAKSFYQSKNRNFELANVIRNLGKIYMIENDFKSAQRCFEKANRLYFMTKSEIGIAHICRNNGELLMKQGKFEEALEMLIKAEKKYDDMNNILGHTSVIYRLGDLYRSQEKWEDAFKYYSMAREEYLVQENRWGIQATAIELMICSHYMGISIDCWKEEIATIDSSMLRHIEACRLKEAKEIVGI